MKNSLRLSLSLGLSLALITGCGAKSSNKSSPPPVAPQLKPDDKPGAVTPDPVVVDKPSTPGKDPKPPALVPEQPPIAAGTPIGPVPSIPGTVTPPVLNPVATPVTPVPSVSSLNGLWGVALTHKPRSCSTIYDIRNAKTLAVYILCPGDAGKTLSIQSETFNFVADDGSNAVYQSDSSTCAAQSRTLRFSYKVASREANRFLVMTEAGRASPELQSIPDSHLAGDLASATRLYDRPIVRGCFVGGTLTKFEARRVLR